jgi:Tol biopolymer transport system component/DNA-binding winged helix-turn-helix (wHTH) protein
MATPSPRLGPKPTILCFGIFEVDLELCEIRKQGRRVPLQQKPFQVLVALLERPGEVVTREEIRMRLWPSDEFGEFDLGINTAVRKIRQVLGDSAETPRFIETLPRVGYRFLAPVESKALQVVPPAAPPVAWYRSRRWKAALLVAGLAGAAALAALILPRSMTTDGVLLKVKPLTAYPGSEGTPSLSPDGSQVAFIWNGVEGNVDVYLKVIGQEKAARLTTDPAPDVAPAWSPDGRWIAFLRSDPRQRNGTVYLISPLGGPEQEVADGVVKGAWTADSQSLLLIVSDAKREGSRIERLSLATRQRQTLASTSEYTIILDLAASPDGSNLAYTRCLRSAFCDIHLMPIAGGNSRRLTYDRAGIAGLAWTPDSKQLVFASSRSGQAKLWRIEPAAVRPAPALVAADQMGVALPSFSQVGGGAPVRLAFQKAAGNSDIRRTEIRRAGGRLSIGESILIAPSTYGEGEPCYSPDGSKIAFQSNRSGNEELWISEADGSMPRSLGAGVRGDLSWSPDGAFLAGNCPLALPDDDGDDVCVQSVKGGPVRKVVSSPKIEGLALWSRDGQWLYFTADYSGRAEIYKVPAAGGQATQLTFHSGWGGFETPDGSHIYFFKDIGGPGHQGNRSMWSMPSGGGPEKVVLEGVDPFFLTVHREGVYFLRRDEPRKDQDTLFLWRYGPGPPLEIGPLKHRPKRAPTGLPVSPDGRYFLTMHQDVVGVDLMIIDDFR